MKDNPEAIFSEAHRLQRLDKVAEAIAAYQRALLDYPEHANSWFNLGLLFRQANRPEEALVCYQKALNLGIAHPEEVHLNRGVIYADYLRRDAEAERELRIALTMQPGFVPALLNSGQPPGRPRPTWPRPWTFTNAYWSSIRNAPWRWRATRTCNRPPAVTLN